MEKSETEINRLEIIESLKNRMSNYKVKKGARAWRAWLDSCLEKLRSHYSDEVLEQYQLTHLLVGGTGYGHLKKFDLEGECSIQKMIEALSID